MSVTVFRAVSGRGAPRLPSPRMRSVPPPSMRHPPATLLAVLMLLVLAKMNVPTPSFHSVLVPAIVELIVAVRPVSTLNDAAPLMVSVPELSVYPVVLKATLPAEIVETLTAPEVPQNTASLPSLQPWGAPSSVSHQLVSTELHMPEPPRFAPVRALLPVVEPSASQYKVPAYAGLANCHDARMAESTAAMVHSALHGC